MQARHTDRYQYFQEQGISTRRFVLPYIQAVKPIDATSRILEVGCGEGGNLIPFLELTDSVTGIDISPTKIKHAQNFLELPISEGRCTILHTDIPTATVEQTGQFDVIFLRDVIEHIPNQHLFLRDIKPYLRKNGVIFFAFPPWHMPFGGHQQVCKNKFLSHLPYFHLLPKPLYTQVLTAFGEPEPKIQSLLHNYDTGITIERFQKIVRQEGYQFVKQDLFLFNPNYEVKFGLKGRKQLPILRNLSYVRNLYTTCMYAVIRAA